MGKALKSLIGWLCFLVIIAGVVLALIPTTREQITDWATKFSPKYNASVEENKKQAEEIASLKEEVKTKQNLIAEKDSLIATKDSQLKDKDNAIANYKTSLESCSHEMANLQEQKHLLCNSLMDIDSYINSNPVELDSDNLGNLEERKNAILTQIDKLNNEIATLTEQKAQLEEDIATLQQEKTTLQNEIAKLKTEKANLQTEVEDLQERLRLSEETAGVEFLFTYYQCYPLFTMRSTKLNDWVYQDVKKSDFNNFLTNEVVGVYEYERVNVKYSTFSNDIEFNVNYYPIYLSDIQWSIDDESKTIDEIRTFLNESTNDYIGIYSYLSLSTDDDSQMILKVNVKTTRYFTGVYYANDNTFIDFDNISNSTFEICQDVTDCFLEYNIYSDKYNLCLRDQNGSCTSCEFVEYDSYFEMAGQKFTREMKTVSAENISMNVSGQMDDNNYSLTFSNGTGLLTITSLTDSSNVQNIELEFVSYDFENRFMTFNRTDNNNEIVMTINNFEIDSNNIWNISIITYNGILLSN